MKIKGDTFDTIKAGGRAEQPPPPLSQTKLSKTSALIGLIAQK